MPELRINGEVVAAGAFAYDGCHKVYLIRNEGELATIRGCGYGDGDILPVSELPRVWAETCFLRFISSADLTEQYVEQGDDPEVTYG